MPEKNTLDRRSFLGAAAASLMVADMSSMGAGYASTGRAPELKRLGPIAQVRAGVLDIGYYETGASDGAPVLLLHGWPYDVHSYVDVAPALSGGRQHRVIRNVGHNLPQEDPAAFAAAVWELASRNR